MKALVFAFCCAAAAPGVFAAADLFPEAPQMRAEANQVGKERWRPMLRYVADLHVRSTHPAEKPFEFPWEEIGPGYVPAFGHWDLIHEILDVLPVAPIHARQQLLNDVRLQLDDGFMPGSVWMPGSGLAQLRNNNKPWFSRGSQGHPPVWVVAAEDYMNFTQDRSLQREFFERATRQIGWFEAHRAVKSGGFFYTDILSHLWESGIDEGVRFDRVAMGAQACVDATSHVYQLCDLAAHWAEQLGEDPTPWKTRAETLRRFIHAHMRDEKDGYFYDVWAHDDPTLRTQAFEGIWPVVVGAASKAEANRVIDEWILNPRRLLAKHPIATVGLSDPHFERRMWRGPAWNSMTYWAARACVRYDRPDAAIRLLEAALDDSADQFARTGTIWEFYDPSGNKPEDLQRKPASKTDHNPPYHDYLGHNPLLAMARLWQQLSTASTAAASSAAK
ncbi:MAG TPA: trehalase family glycosidase [Opitutaceae bacterium]|nr:trehalase family glycosidase [Opitutaceae bacterium]